MLKIRRSWNMPAAAAAVLLAGLAVQAAEAGQLLRLRFGNGALATGTFLVLEREEPDSVMVCRLLSGNGQFRIHSSWLEQLPFGEKASVFAVSEYLFFACFEDKKSAGAYAELGEALGLFLLIHCALLKSLVHVLRNRGCHSKGRGGSHRLKHLQGRRSFRAG